MVTDDDIQGFRFMGEPHESDHTVIELKYATARVNEFETAFARNY